MLTSKPLAVSVWRPQRKRLQHTTYTTEHIPSYKNLGGQNNLGDADKACNNGTLPELLFVGHKDIKYLTFPIFGVSRRRREDTAIVDLFEQHLSYLPPSLPFLVPIVTVDDLSQTYIDDHLLFVNRSGSMITLDLQYSTTVR
jgi:hypothetical protein